SQDVAFQAADVVAVLREIAGQSIEKLLVARRIGDGEVVNGMNQTYAEVVGPNAVHEASGKEGIVRLHEPVAKFDTDVPREFKVRPAQCPGLQSAAGGMRQAPQVIAAHINLAQVRQSRPCLLWR